MRKLNFLDILAILFIWAGVVAIVYFAQDTLITVICIAAAYYLTKWIILKD